MNDFFRLDDREFDFWQSKFISYVEHKCREWVVSLDRVQALIIYQSNWSAVFENMQQALDQENSVTKVTERTKYQKMIEKFVLCLIEKNANIKSDLEMKILEWMDEAHKETGIINTKV